MKDGPTELLSFLATQHERAQLELDELRQRGLELVIAACIVEVHGRPSGSRSVPPDTSVLSEADVATKPARPAQPKPEDEPKPETAWEWLAPDEPPTLEDEPELPVDEPEPPVDEPEAPSEASEPAVREPEAVEPATSRRVEQAQPAPPVSPDPAVEDVRGAWNPPRDG